MTGARVLDFTIAVHSGFRVGAAYGRDGVDLAVDVDDPLPASHLKGLMRSSACHLAALLRIHPGLLEAVFGSTDLPASWSWTGARPADASEWTVSTRHRVAIDQSVGAARKDHLVRAHRVDTKSAAFTVHRLSAAPGEAVGGIEAEEALLRLSARHTHHLGAWRRRGWGWVDIVPDPRRDDQLDADLDLVLSTVPDGER